MKSSTNTDILSEIGAEFAKPCQSPEQCDFPATVAIWCDHHSQDCPYVGYRCDIHRNMLLLETRRMIDHLAAGGTAICGRCNSEITGTLMQDHLRWLPL